MPAAPPDTLPALLASLFDAGELRWWLGRLEGLDDLLDGASAVPGRLPQTVAQGLAERGRIDRALFHSLRTVRPGRRLDIDRVARTCLEARDAVGMPPFRLPRMAVFVGRNQELDAIHQAVKAHPRVVLTGAPGVGRRALANRAARDLQDQFSLVAWLEASNTDVLDGELSAMAAALELPSAPDQGAAAARRWLADNKGWMLILAGVGAGVVDALPVGPGKTLVTADTWSHPGQVIQIGPMTTEDAEELVVRRAGADAAPTTLVRRLGGHPLLLSMAGAHARATGTLPGASSSEVPGSTNAVEDLADELLGIILPTLEPADLGLLRWHGALGVGAVPIDLLDQVPPATLPPPLREAVGTRFSRDGILRTLDRRVLIQRRGDTTDIHPLIATAVDRATPRDAGMALRGLAVQQLCASARSALASGQAAVARARLGRASSIADTIADHPDCTMLLDELGSVAIAVGWPVRAVAFHRQALARTPDPHPLQRCALAASQLAAGDPVTARQTLALALSAAATLSGRAQVEAQAHCAVLQRKMGDSAAAVHTAALALASDALTPADPLRGVILSNQAVALSAAGDLDRAIPLWTEALTISTEALGIGHPRTETVRESLASALRARGDLDACLDLRRQAAAAVSLQRGRAHPDTATATHALAETLHARGGERDLEQARRLYIRALEIRTSTLGLGHAHTWQTLEALARLEGDCGDPEAAAYRLSRARARAAREVGPDHPRAIPPDPDGPAEGPQMPEPRTR